MKEGNQERMQKEAHQHMVASEMPTSKKCTQTTDTTMSTALATLSPYLQKKTPHITNTPH